jgi:hypothetical protein
MKIPCSSCNQRLEIPEELAGQTIDCPACNATLAVPALETPPPAVPQVQESAPQAASSKKSKSSIPKWAIASVAGIAVVVVGLIMFFPDKAVKTDEESQRPSPPAESKPIEPVAEVPSQQSAPSPESKPVEPVAEASQPEPPSEADRALFKAAAGVELGDTSVRFSGESEAGNIEAVKQHLAAGADVDVKGGWRGGTPLYYAVGEGRNEIAKLLIAKGADVNVKGKFGGTPLHLATTKEIAGLLIAEGADVNAKDERGKTPLDLAIQVRNTKTADLLRKHGGKTGEELKAEGN